MPRFFCRRLLPFTPIFIGRLMQFQRLFVVSSSENTSAQSRLMHAIFSFPLDTSFP
ncbi:hypothetical protein HETIRDRAFT_174450 [Heterobasidion irregulare TC 32-1]|uniref:Uncharacterized protein n=1 Tax=Heterobasidion irregulare (strain TC 32-1) TaxID=747525 RepID=W4JU32_HETIT|nr:uncharacterized protein HETIRDRAFT_174450 [Heterobasidion irregulare TC 32-1]ETW76376.1 hypothetical protein HETIRDRAFT_174450 [Heterobasidion irregulare TC 32-1]